MQRLVVNLVDFGANLHAAAALAVVVVAHVDAAASLEVGVQMKLLTVEVTHRRVAELHEVVGQNLGAQSHRDAVGTLAERKLHRQGDGLLVAAVVAQLPLRRLGVEHRVERKLAQSRLDVSRGGSPVAGQDVAPVALAVNQQILLPQGDQRRIDGGIAVGVVLHRIAHNVRHLVEPAVVHLLHRVEQTALHRLQSVTQMGHRAVKDGIAGVVQKPVLIHTAQPVHRLRVVMMLIGIIGGMAFARGTQLLTPNFYLIVHKS